jgi:2-polyprenyl-3-methyl-5-hydroxy-6-metoxy-1,4-benzoquinol methylase
MLILSPIKISPGIFRVIKAGTMTSETDYEKLVKTCYSTWSTTYYDEYYSSSAPYPPVHRDLIKAILLERGAKTLLDAGCGPASFLRDLTDTSIQLYGFDLTPEMIQEAQRVMGGHQVPASHFWEGSVTNPASYQAPGDIRFDSAVCIGVLPHIPPEADQTVLENLYQAVEPGGTVIVEARNQFFALFTLNRYSYQFFAEELLPLEAAKAALGEEKLQPILDEIQPQFRMDLPPIRTGKQDEPGYDQVLSRTHNPLVLHQMFQNVGFQETQVLFYHYHALPPMVEKLAPEFFRQQSLAMENPLDWRGYFMASAFLLVGKRP